MRTEKEIKEAIEIIEKKIERNEENPFVWFDKQMADTLRWTIKIKPKYTKED
jgi:hypothetical protein